MEYVLVIVPILWADAGVPMIFLAFPAMMALLVPIILVESILCKRWLKLTMWDALKSNTLSNLVSTIIGIPAAWAIMFGVELVTFGIVDSSQRIQSWSASPFAQVVGLLLDSAWLGPPSQKNIWIIPAAAMVLLIPFFLISYWIEYLVVRRMVGMPEGGPPNVAYQRVRMAVRNANLATYGAIFVGVSVWLVYSFLTARF